MSRERELLVRILGLDKADPEGRGFVELLRANHDNDVWWLTLDGSVENLTSEDVALIREIFSEIDGEAQA